MILTFPLSSKSHTILFRIFLGVFVVLYFIPIGINIHKIQILHIAADYLIHGIFCFILFFLYAGSLDKEEDKTSVSSFFLKIIALALIVSSFEYLQLLTPTRSFDTKDLLSNFTGMIPGVLMQLFTRHYSLLSR